MKNRKWNALLVDSVHYWSDHDAKARACSVHFIIGSKYYLMKWYFQNRTISENAFESSHVTKTDIEFNIYVMYFYIYI